MTTSSFCPLFTTLKPFKTLGTYDPSSLILSHDDSLNLFLSHVTDYIAIDTEFTRRDTYFPQSSLIQMEANGHVGIIDLVSFPSLDLRPLQKILTTPHVTKIFHAARGDLEVLFHLFKELPCNVFDTQIAAMISGMGEQVSYSQLIKQLFQQETGPSFQKTNWQERPLTNEKIHYALTDVLYLKPCYDALSKKLSECQRSTWLQEEMEDILQEKTFIPTPQHAWQKLNILPQSPLQQKALAMLAEWRENKAIKHNKPKNWIIKDEALAKLSLLFHNKGKTSSLPSWHSFWKIWKQYASSDASEEIERFFNTLVHDIQKTNFPPHKNNKKGHDTATSLLKILRKNHAQNLNIPPKFLCSNEEIKEIASLSLKQQENLKDIKALTSWRLKTFGNDALDLINGKLFISCKQEQVLFYKKEEK